MPYSAHFLQSWCSFGQFLEQRRQRILVGVQQASLTTSDKEGVTLAMLGMQVSAERLCSAVFLWLDCCEKANEGNALSKLGMDPTILGNVKVIHQLACTDMLASLFEYVGMGLGEYIDNACLELWGDNLVDANIDLDRVGTLLEEAIVRST